MGKYGLMKGEKGMKERKVPFIFPFIKDLFLHHIIFGGEN